MNEILDDCINHDVPRTAVEIAKRALVLHCVIAVSEKVSKLDMSKWLKDEKLYDELSPWERRFMEAPENTKREITAASWRVEAQVALLWSIRKTARLDELTEQCNSTPLVDAIPDLFSSTKDFIESAHLRSAEEISDEYERVYDIHCNLKTSPVKYDSGVVQERHYAFNWITGYCGQAWDEITTDT